MGPTHQGGRHLCGLMANTPNCPVSLVPELVTIGRLPVSRLANISEEIRESFATGWPLWRGNR